MQIIAQQSGIFAAFALGLWALMAELTRGAAHGECLMLCCGLTPGLTAALLVVLLHRLFARSRVHPFLPSVILTIIVSIKASPIVCAHLCGNCSHTQPGVVGITAFIFGILGAGAGMTMLEVNREAQETSVEEADAAPTPTSRGSRLKNDYHRRDAERRGKPLVPGTKNLHKNLCVLCVSVVNDFFHWTHKMGSPGE